MPVSDAFATLLNGQPLSESQTEMVFDDLLAGALSEPQIAALLALLQARGVTTDELVGAARAMRRHATRIPISEDLRARVIDTCGTGGAPKTFNVSTIVAIVVAAASEGGLVVAKHGNRSRSGRGSAEVLAGLGVNVDAPPEVQARCLDRAGVCFCFAIHHHPAARHAAGVRRALGFPTIFNLLGPLTNPAGAPRQLLGVFDRAAVPMMAAALGRLGSTRALVVHGSDGMDEITTTGPTFAAESAGGTPREFTIDPGEIGVAVAPRAALEAKDLDDAIAIVRAVLGGERSPRRDIVVLNAARALVVGGAAADVVGGARMAERAIDGGAALRTLELLRINSRA